MTSCMAMLCSCKDEPMRRVDLELVNPTTGEIIKEWDTIDLPTERLPFEVRVKDSETGEYLTDDDIPELTIKECCHARFELESKDYKQTIPFETDGLWPLVEDTNFLYHHCRVTMYFECEPEYLRNDPNYKKKYYDTHRSVKFYINK